MAVVKANAYGHGLEFAARTLASHVDAFATATLEEGQTLRKSINDHPIVCLSGLMNSNQLPDLYSSEITPVIFDLVQVKWFEASAFNFSHVWLKIDTGMGRLGIAPDDVPLVMSRLLSADIEVSLMTHFACADVPSAALNETQHRVFAKATEAYNCPRSAANSAAILGLPHDHHDVIRPGIMLYGSSPLAHKSAESLGLNPVMRLYAKVLTIREMMPGDSVGYGARWIADQPSRVAVVSIGYADGYPRGVSDQAMVYINGHRHPVIGRVSMDSLTVLLDHSTRVDVGDVVELWGENISIDETAVWANTIGYELMCKLSNRVERVEV